MIANYTHAGILQHYHQLLVDHLCITSSLYRRLKENGILTVDQIGLLELEESPYKKVSKLTEILKNADHHVFTSFCAILHETGQHQLAQTLHRATRNRQTLPAVSSVTQTKQVVNESILQNHEWDRTLKEENQQMRKKIQDMRNKYMKNLHELDEWISLAKWERDLAIKERNIILSENEALQNLNTELEALLRKLQERTLHYNFQDVGVNKDFTKEKSRKRYPGSHVELIYS
ncbi:uncharacterized protein LOC128647710 [Bombina bombina]|uniref:uncharacterized protein LOC128647710 n=1 Tax=Bombina bombina TaxID=8345 RepID=UPI00235AABC1|nr:uncharacterized protein LOC128647710 [Bombina bombina]